MKKNQTISTLLGVSQFEMAALLKITRGQWSMYESGKRSLPLAAREQMNKFLTHVQDANSKKAKNELVSSQQRNNTKQELDALLRDNENQQLTVERKIAGVLKKQAEAVAALQLVDFLATQDHKEDYYPGLLQLIERKAKRKTEENNEAVLITHQIKQALLQHEAELLKTALENNKP